MVIDFEQTNRYSFLDGQPAQWIITIGPCEVGPLARDIASSATSLT